MTPRMETLAETGAIIVTPYKPHKAEPAASEYITTKNGTIRPLMANVMRLLNTAPEWVGVLAFDEFSYQHTLLRRPPTESGTGQFQPRAVKDRDLRAITKWVQENGITANATTVSDSVLGVGDETRTHPVKKYLSRLKWDKTSRLETFLIEHAGIEDTQLNRALSVRWMIQAVARIHEPGCQADSTIILEGEQGIGKSTLLKTLFGTWYADHLPDLSSKDAMVQLRGVWCIEIAELASLSKADAGRIKAFLTSREDRYRAPFGRLAENIPRSTVFAGTVNPGGMGYLKDSTGARRFWPIEIPRTIDIAAISKMRDQLWAEAQARFLSNEPWHLDTIELVTAAADAQAERFQCDPWQDNIERYIDQRDRITIDELLEHAIIIAKDRQTQREQNRVAAVLKHLGWVRRHEREGARRVYVYRRSALSPVSPL
jgi:predicted P-loop ATPase